MSTKNLPFPIQEIYADDQAVCYGCGRLNAHGLQIKSYWDGEEAVCHYTPQPYHTALPGFTYGGLLASLIDCHATGTAAAALYTDEGGSAQTAPRFVTGTLSVRYEAPTPIEGTLELRGRISEIAGRKVTVEVDLFSGDRRTVTGKAIVFRVPDGS